MDAAAFKQLRRLRTLGRGASGAVVWLATDESSGQLLAVKSAMSAAAVEQLRREARVLSGLRSPHIVPCLGVHADAGSGEYRLFLEFASRGSLADEAARSDGGCLEERDIRRYAADVARSLAYLHGESVVHGDVKAANVVLGGDGRAKLADFGCARAADDGDRQPIAGTPAFMAPEVARGEEQGPAADVWALACMVIEMATGAAPWSDTADDVYAAVHKIAYTDAVPEVPAWLSSEAKDFLSMCLERNPRRRPTAAQVLDHPFIVSAEPAGKHNWTSPKSTLETAFWESDDEEEDEAASESAAARISSLASSCSALPDWDCSEEEEGWIDVHSECSQGSEAAPAATAVTTASAGFGLRSDEAPYTTAEVGLHAVDVEDAIRYPTSQVGVVEDFVKSQQRHSSLRLGGIGLCFCPVSFACYRGETLDRNSVVLVMTNEKSSFDYGQFGHFATLL